MINMLALLHFLGGGAMKLNSTIGLMLSTAVSALLVSPAYGQSIVPGNSSVIDKAQAEGSGEPNSADIVVTAQRRVERVQDVPIAVTVVSGEQVARQRINSLADLTRVSASLQLNQNPGGTGGGGYIRGVGTFARSRSAEPSVGIVVDGVVQGLTNIRNLNDIARLEVLRGPQGTLFGQSVSAGVINIATTDPTYDRISGRVSTELSSNNFGGSEFGRQVGRASLNLPLANNAAVRISGYGSSTRGVIENALNGRLDSSNEYGARARFKTEIGSVTANLIAEYAYQRNGNGGGFAVPWRILDRTGADITNDPTKSRVGLAYAACGLHPAIDNTQNCSDGPSIQEFKTRGFSAQFDLDEGPVRLTSITAYRALNSQTNNDVDQLPTNLETSQQQSGLKTNYKQLTQEFRAVTNPDRPLSVTVGGFYFRSTVTNRQGPSVGLTSTDFQQRALLPISTCFPVPTVAACTIGVSPAARNAESGQDNVNENLSGFGEVRFKSGALTTFAGARVTSAKVVQTGYNNVTGGAQQKSDNRFKDTNLSGRLGIQYQIERDVMVYATYSTGYKGAQVAPIQGAQPATTILPEKPQTYEVGLKTSFFNRSLNFNLDAFHSRVRNYQTSSCAVVNNLVQCVPQNISQVVSKGIEADLFGRINRNWSVNATAIYNDISYPDGFLADNGSSLAGQQLLAAPKFAATFGTDYSVPLNDKLSGFLSADINYSSRIRLATNTNSLDYTFKGHANVGGRVGVRVDKSWTVAAFVDNLFSQNDPGSVSILPAHYPGNATSPNGLPAGTPIGVQVQGVVQTTRSLRQVGLQASLNF